MITVIFLLVFIVGITIYNGTANKYPNQPFYIRYRKPIILFAMTLIPVVAMNILKPEPGKNASRAYLELEGENLDYYPRLDVYEDVMRNAPNDIDIRFEFIDFAMDFAYYDHESLAKRRYSSNELVQNQCLAYLEAKYILVDPEWETLVKYTLSGNDPYDNYILGIKHTKLGEFQKAKSFFLKEIKIQPEFDDGYYYLIDLCRNHIPEEYEKYLLDYEFSSHLSFHQQRYNYYSRGDFINYIKTITVRSLTDIDLMAFIAALIISIVWMIFLRSMDVFNKEKWLDILIVFVLGGLFTHLCLLGYDFARHTLDFNINGNAFNDFWYCTLIIGGSEELVKLIPWLAFIILARKAKEPYDYILYASISALGFAFVENLVYLEDPGNIVTRSIMSTIAHMFFASLVAYSMVLAKYKVKDKILKKALPFIGFALACVGHGFYDFWLISPAFQSLSFLTVIFFVMSLHVWFILLNNAINNSPFYKRSMFNSNTQLDILTFGIIGVLVVEYLIIAIDYGGIIANHSINRNGWMVIIFLSYMTAILLKMKIIPGRWRKYKFSLPTGVGHFFRFSAPSSFDIPEAPSYDGMELRLFVQKSNRFVADKFPVSGFVLENIELSQSDNWHIFQLNKPISYGGFRDDKVIIRTQNNDESLEIDKVEIVLLFIPNHISLSQKGLRVEDMRYTGRAFARPL